MMVTPMTSAAARVPPGRVDGDQEPDEERAGLRERGGREVRELDDEERERQRHERRAAAPGERGAEGERRGEADRAIAREGRLGGDLDAIRPRPAPAAIRRSAWRDVSSRTFIGADATSAAPPRHRSRGRCSRAGSLARASADGLRGRCARPRRWDRLRRRFQRSTGGRHEDAARHADRRGRRRRRRRAAGHRPGGAGREDLTLTSVQAKGVERSIDTPPRGHSMSDSFVFTSTAAQRAADGRAESRATASPSTSGSRARSARSRPCWPTARSRCRARR